MKNQSIDLDKLDITILKAVQEDGRASLVELSDRVALSPTAVQRRLKRLEEVGIITGYRATVSLPKLGYAVQAFVKLALERQAREELDQLISAMRNLPQVRAAYVLSGDSDFMLHVIAEDLEAFREFILSGLLTLPGVKDVRSSIVLDVIPGGAALTPPASP